MKRMRNLRAAIAADRAGRLKEVKKEVEWYLEREKYCDVAVRGLADGTLPLRVTHNDTKLNNVLINREKGEAVAVIDLDTVMKGSILYDFGDGITAYVPERIRERRTKRILRKSIFRANFSTLTRKASYPKRAGGLRKRRRRFSHSARYS